MMKSHPLARILRVDKMTLSAMEATFKEYYDDENAKEKIPVLSMLTRSEEKLKTDAEKLLEMIKKEAPALDAKVEATEDVVGGGSAPATVLKGYSVSVQWNEASSQEIERRLRMDALPIIVRINHDKVLFDVRTIAEDEYRIIADRLKRITEK